MKGTRLLIVALAGITLLSACGGGGGGAAKAPTTTARPLTPRATLVKNANSRCSELIKARKSLVDGFLAQHQVTDAAATRDFLVNQLAPIYDQTVGGFHRQGAPAEDSSEWLKILEAVDSDLAAWKQTIDSDPAGAISGDPFADITPRMVAFGVTECAAL
jgi:hypothetical protein